MRAGKRTLAALIAGALGLALGGCYGPGGPGWSADQHTYESTSTMPWTVDLYDTRTGETFWTYEVPVGRQLVIRFLAGQGTDDAQTPDKMQWGEMDIGDRFGKLESSTPVPPAWARLLEPRLRPTPELPPEMIAEESIDSAVEIGSPGN